MDIIKGKVIVLGDDVDTDQILPGYAMAEPMDQLGKFAMAGLAGLDFKSVFEPGSILVAGRNFGCGSSREQAPIALRQVGVSLVIAKGFARIFRRNSINIGLPIVECPQAAEEIQAGDQVEVDFATGLITDQTTGKTYQAAPFPEFIDGIIKSGGLLNSLKARGVAK